MYICRYVYDLDMYNVLYRLLLLYRYVFYYGSDFPFEKSLHFPPKIRSVGGIAYSIIFNDSVIMIMFNMV